jgi:leucine dehydrogenase
LSILTAAAAQKIPAQQAAIAAAKARIEAIGRIKLPY